MRRTLALLLLITLLLPAMGLAAATLAFLSAPDTLRPGKIYAIRIDAPSDGQLSVLLADATDQVVYDVFTDYPVTAGENTLYWDGLRADYSIIDQGDYSFQLLMDDEIVSTHLRIGAPYPLLSHIRQSDIVLTDNPVEVSFEASTAGTVRVALRAPGEKAASPLVEVPANAGAGSFLWDGTRNGSPCADGQYTLQLTLHTDNGMESMSHQVSIEIGSPEAEETESIVMETTPTPEPTEEPAAPEPTEEPTPEPEETPAAPVGPESNPPYSTVSDGSYWAMTPGELDDAKIWEIMTQPITVYKDVDQKEHVYLMENPDGTGAQVAQIHGQSQGLHVLGETNEHGYVLVEAFSSYDDVYTPKTDEEKAHALEIKQGYVKASGLKTVQVQQDMGILVDKLSQRLYLFKNGERITELLICTGLIVDEKYHYETTVGEFITVSHSGGFYSNKYMYCDMSIRINGGILLHEVPYEPLGDGSKNYKPYEPLLGTKASHGCIRIQRQKNEDGYNHRWLWDNLQHGKPYKVIIWDDLNRYDTPETWYPNPS